MSDCRTSVEQALWHALKIARAERDDARRMFCIINMKATGEDPLTSHIQDLARHDAESRGWDCFQENSK